MTKSWKRAAVRYPESEPALRVSRLVIAVRRTLGSIGEAAKTASSNSVSYRFGWLALLSMGHLRPVRTMKAGGTRANVTEVKNLCCSVAQATESHRPARLVKPGDAVLPFVACLAAEVVRTAELKEHSCALEPFASAPPEPHSGR